MFVVEVRYQSFQTRAKLARGFQTFRQRAVLELPTTGTHHFVLASFDDHGMDFWQLSDLATQNPLGRDGMQIRPTA
jgi:hypothetical protein